MNGDGFLDLVGGFLRDNYSVFYYKGNGTDTVTYVKNLGRGKKMGQGTLADFDNDGDYDLLYSTPTTCLDTTDTSWYSTGYMINTGSRKNPVITRDNNFDLVDTGGNRLLTNNIIKAVDFDGDNQVELMYTRITSISDEMEDGSIWKDLSIEILENAGNNTFYTKDTVMTLESISWQNKFCPGFGDLNGDGILDMIYIIRHGRALYVKWGSNKGENTLKSIPQSISSVSICDNVLKFSEKYVTSDKKIFIYTLGGKLIKRITLSGIGVYDLRSLSLPKGVYIVSLKLDGVDQHMKWQMNN